MRGSGVRKEVKRVLEVGREVRGEEMKETVKVKEAGERKRAMKE